jgi:MFS transporter, DHA2 family, multidrug resistance protein
MTTVQTPSRQTGKQAHPWAALAVLTLSLLVVVVDLTVLNVALPEMVDDLALSSVSQLWVVDAYALVLAAFLIPITSLADRWGRKRMLIAGYAIFAVGSVAVLWADSAGSVIALRALLGVGGAMIMPSTLSLIRAVFPDPTQRALALSVWGATAAAGTAIGPVVGGALLEAFSWHAAFLLNVPLMLVAIAGGLWLLPESRSARPGRIDALSVLLSGGGTAVLVYAVKDLGKHGPSLAPLALIVIGAIALTVFVRRSLQQSAPMLDVRLFAIPVLRAGVVAALASSISMIAVLFVGSQWLQIVVGWGPLRSGVALLPLAAGAMIATPFAPALAARTSPRVVLTGGLGVLAIGLVSIAVLPTTYAFVAASFAVIGLGTSALGLASALIMGSANDDQAGSAAAIEEITYELGAVIGITFLGSLTAAAYRAGLPEGVSQPVRESVAGAVGTDSFLAASASFVHAFAVVSGAGAVLAAAAAWVVWRLIPATHQLSDSDH